MLFKIHNNNQYKDVTISDSGTTIELGLLDADDRRELAIALLGAVSDLVYNDMNDSVDYHNFLKVYS